MTGEWRPVLDFYPRAWVGLMSTVVCAVEEFATDAGLQWRFRPLDEGFFRIDVRLGTRTAPSGSEILGAVRRSESTERRTSDGS